MASAPSRNGPSRSPVRQYYRRCSPSTTRRGRRRDGTDVVVQRVMARTKQTARKSTGGRAPRCPYHTRAAPRGTHDFQDRYGMPTLLWRLLGAAGYQVGSEPSYRWTRTHLTANNTWFTVEVRVPARAEGDLVWTTRTAVGGGRTPADGAMTAAYAVLMEIMEERPPEFLQFFEGIFPRDCPYHSDWAQPQGTSLERSAEEIRHCDTRAASVVFALMKAYASMERSFETMAEAYGASGLARDQAQEDHQAEVTRLSAELSRVTVQRDRARRQRRYAESMAVHAIHQRDAANQREQASEQQVRKMAIRLEEMRTSMESNDPMVARMVQERNEALSEMRNLRACQEQVMSDMEDVRAYNASLHEEMHRMQDELRQLRIAVAEETATCASNESSNNQE